MAKKNFETENLPGALFGFQWTALRLLEELAQRHPDREFIEGLRQKVVDEIKNGVTSGMPMEAEKPYFDASIGAVNFVFDHIHWR